MSIPIRFRPFDAWPDRQTVRRRADTFRVGYAATLNQLQSELRQLGAREATISTGHTARDIRLDGWPRADARKPVHPGVLLYVTTRDHGQLSFACDTYTDWTGNLRGIGPTLEALRAVERYGASKGGAQYRGYAALPPPPPSSAQQSGSSHSGAVGHEADMANYRAREQAVNLLLRTAGRQADPAGFRFLMRGEDGLDQLYRAASLRAHPDTGGDHDGFIAVTAAYELLKGGAQ